MYAIRSYYDLDDLRDDGAERAVDGDAATHVRGQAVSPARFLCREVQHRPTLQADAGRHDQADAVAAGRRQHGHVITSYSIHYTKLYELSYWLGIK